MNNNKKFWNRFAFIYERVQTTGRKSKEFYRILNQEICNQLSHDMKVLELAMGPALLTKEIAMHCKELYATDFSENMVREAKKKGIPDNVIIKQADATKLPYENESFDAVVIANALHIMPNPEKAIKEIKRVLKKDGVIIAPTYTRETAENKFKLKLMNAMGFITFFPWNDADYKHFIEEQQLQITYSTVIKWADFPESFVVCKNIDSEEEIKDEI